eukprot:g53798.t1
MARPSKETWSDQYPRWVAGTEPLPLQLLSLPPCQADTGPVPEFGLEARRKLFSLEEGVCFLNHGSYGAAFLSCQEHKRFYQARLESQPVRFFREEMMQLLAYATRSLAPLIGADPRDVVLVPNATTAVNAVAKSFLIPPLQPQLSAGAVVLTLSTGYNAVLLTLGLLARAANATLVKVEVPFPFSDELLLAAHAGLRDADQAAGSTVPRSRPTTVLPPVDHGQRHTSTRADTQT